MSIIGIKESYIITTFLNCSFESHISCPGYPFFEDIVINDDRVKLIIDAPETSVESSACVSMRHDDCYFHFISSTLTNIDASDA